MHEEVEQLREALASAKQLAAAQEARLRQQDLVLSGIEAISVEDEPAAAIANAFEVLRTAVAFDHALVLEPREAGYACVAATNPSLVGAEWPAGDFFTRVAAGRPGVVPDVSRVPDWIAGPAGVTAVGALFTPLSTAAGAGLLILCADRHGAYSASDLALVARLGLLVSQTLAAGQQRRLAEAVRRSEVEREAAVHANEVKSRFFANMSHEVRTPLNGVIAVADILARTELSPRQQEMVDLILDSGRMLERVLNDVLDFSKIESGRLGLDLQPCNPADALRSVFDLFAAKADEKGLALTVAVEPGADGWFEADSLRIRQVVSNLLSNAVKFTEAGGVHVALGAEERDGEVLLAIRVRDTGCGFQQETAERLFERFEQEDGSITRKFGGSGLGLSIARAIARLMGGDIGCESAPGRGAEFRFWFPARRAEAARPCEAAPEVRLAEPEAALRVLVAEDNPNNQRIIGMILEIAGIEAVFACDGREACEAVAVQRFDVILMDLQMPVMDGLTAMRRIRARERAENRARTPIVAVSANAMTHQVEEALAAGADAHVSKPIDPAALLTAIAELCAGPEEAAEPSAATPIAAPA
jgi:signal transduction histidine kinase/ActR/RegA family two-component response regulator